MQIMKKHILLATSMPYNDRVSATTNTLRKNVNTFTQ